MSSDSDSSDEDVNLREAVDLSLFTNAMFQDKPQGAVKVEKKVSMKSNRKLEEPVVNKEDIQVTPSMQNYVAKKLSSLIENQVQFVESTNVNVPEDPVDNNSDDCGIRLFSNSTAVVSSKTIDEDIPSVPAKKSKKSAKKRKLRERSPSPDESTKISQCAVDPSFILDQVEVRSWHHNEERLNKRLDCYNLRNGQLFPVEPTNEFSKQRRKNNWDYKKIRQPIKGTQ